MKSVEELYLEIKNDEKQRKSFIDAYSRGDVDGFLKENGCDATSKEMMTFISKQAGTGKVELSDEELALVIGGKGGNDTNPSNSGQRYPVGAFVEYVIPELLTVHNSELNTSLEGTIVGYANELYSIQRDDWYGEGIIDHNIPGKSILRVIR